jgi:hypothetical protein
MYLFQSSFNLTFSRVFGGRIKLLNQANFGLHSFSMKTVSFIGGGDQKPGENHRPVANH